ncbi:hypothetical protein B0H19DRAFT_1152332, partial [Mycena capillaripes]
MRLAFESEGWSGRRVLLFHGTADFTVPPAHANRIARSSKPQDETHRIPGSPHPHQIRIRIRKANGTWGNPSPNTVFAPRREIYRCPSSTGRGTPSPGRTRRRWGRSFVSSWLWLD